MGNFTELKTDEHTKNQNRPKDIPVENGTGFLSHMPSSQVLYFDNLQNSSNDFGGR